MKYEGFIKLTPREWDIVRNLDNSLTMKEISLKSGIPPTTTSNTLRKIKNVCKAGFNPDYKKLGLISYMIFSEHIDGKYIDYPYVYSVRKASTVNGKRIMLLSAIVPYYYSNEFEQLLDFNKIYSIKTFHRIIWRPSKSKLTTYREGYLLPLFNMFHKAFETNALIKKDKINKPFKVDRYDIFIISYKTEDLFFSLRKLSRKTYGRVSHQLLSYHYRAHVMKLWDGNFIKFYGDVKRVPIWILVLKGSDAEAFARTLVELPGFYRALLGDGEALVSAQVPYSVKLHVYSLVREYDVEILYNLNIRDADMKVQYPFRYFKGKRWLSPKEVLEKGIPEKVLIR